jgi:hypothetical protein
MSDKIVKITITPEGEAKIDAQGFTGGSCKDATKIFENLYSNKLDYADKPELYQGASCASQAVKVNQ